MLKWLIDAGVDVNKQNSIGITALHMAAQEGHTHIVMDLIKAGADVNLATAHGRTPLHQAAWKGHDGIVVALITAGADINKVNKSGKTALGYAERHNHEKMREVVEALRSALPKRKPRGRHLVTPRGESTSSSPHIGALYVTL